MLPLLVLAGYVYSVDPYWVFHEKPNWAKKHDYHNRVLDIRSRFAKSLQVIVRQPDIIVMGSSRVYRGISFEGLAFADRAYNFGLSSLRIAEAYSYLKHAIRWTSINEIVLGLDYFMFNSEKPWENGFDQKTSDLGFLINGFFSSLMTYMAFKDAKLAMAGEHKGDGAWSIQGYKATNPRSAKEVNRIKNTFYNNSQVVTAVEYSNLSNIVNYAKTHKVRLSLFISPLNKEMIQRMRSKNEYDSFVLWKKNVYSIASNGHVALHDFSENNPFFDDYIGSGSTKYWIDTSHYSPFVGNWILNEIMSFSDI